MRGTRQLSSAAVQPVSGVVATSSKAAMPERKLFSASARARRESPDHQVIKRERGRERQNQRGAAGESEKGKPSAVRSDDQQNRVGREGPLRRRRRGRKRDQEHQQRGQLGARIALVQRTRPTAPAVDYEMMHA